MDEKDIFLNVGMRIKEFRLLHNLKQEELATAIGIETKYLSTVERGKRFLHLSKLIDICCYFNITLDTLLNIPKEKITENDIIKQKELQSIIKLLDNCNTSQLASIRQLIENVILYI